jgi:hypothetical protein
MLPKFRFSLVVCLLTVFVSARANDKEAPADHGGGADKASSSAEATAEEEAPPEPGTLVVRESPAEIMIPSKIWDLIYADEKSKPRVVFAPVKLQMKERNPGILTQEEVIIQFPRGGGEVDLSQFVTEKRGSFFVNFTFEKGGAPESSYVFFVSRNRKRKVDGMILGSGCKSFYDVKTYLGKTDKQGGILVNTTRLRHLSVLGGSFVFANVTGKEVRLAQVSFKDSKNPKYFCEVKSTPSQKSEEAKDESAEGL